MTYRVPYLKVIGPDGTDLIPVWGSRLIGVKIVSRYLDDSDECTFMFTNGPPYATAPAERTPFSVSIGWAATSAALAGTFYLDTIRLAGEPKRGEEVHYVCLSAKMSDLDQAGSQHFSAENGHNTLGDVFRTLFKGGTMAVEVAASIAGLPLPGNHLVQWQQSAIDFATDLANDAGGIVKPMGGKILVLDRNAGQSVSGQALAPFTIQRTPGYQYDVELHPRFQYKSVAVSYLDSDAGRLKVQNSPDQGSTGANMMLPHPAADQAAAATKAKAVADEYKRFTGTGLFVMPGEPNAVVGALPKCSGFPDPIDSTSWLAVEVTHDVVPDQGWTTTVETETDPNQN